MHDATRITSPGFMGYRVIYPSTSFGEKEAVALFFVGAILTLPWWNGGYLKR